MRQATIAIIHSDTRDGRTFQSCREFLRSCSRIIPLSQGQTNHGGEAAGGLTFPAVAGEQVITTEGADAGDVNRFTGQAAADQGVGVRFPKVEMVPCAGPGGKKEGCGVRPNAVDGGGADLVANLVTAGTRRGTDARDQVIRTTTQIDHSADGGRNDTRDGRPPGSVGKPNRSTQAISDEHNRTIAAFTQHRQPWSSGHEPIGASGAAPPLGHQDLAPVDLLQEGRVLQIQDAGDFPSRRGRIVSDLLHIGSLPGSHKMRNPDGLQRNEPPDQPPVRQVFQPEPAAAISLCFRHRSPYRPVVHGFACGVSVIVPRMS